MSTNDWLAQLKEGDTVVSLVMNRPQRVEKVRSVTSSEVVTEGGWIYSRNSGALIGAPPDFGCSLAEPNEETLAVIRENRLRSRISAMTHEDWRRFPLSVLEQVNAVLEAHVNAEKEG